MSFEDIATKAIHADRIHADTSDVAPPLRMSTTYDYSSQSSPEDMSALEKAGLIYQRENHPGCIRAEEVLSSVIGKPTLLFNSGMSAFFAAMETLAPKNVFIGDPNYGGVVGVLRMCERKYGLQVHDIDADPSLLQPGDFIHLESPVNPNCTARNIQQYADIAHSRGALLLVDSTFAPPPLCDPFQFGADIVFHSATKYFGGHSDLLAGTLSFEDSTLYQQCAYNRGYMGSISSPWESWLILRSMKTYALRIEKQAHNANEIVRYLNENKQSLSLLDSVSHSSLETAPWVKKQMPHGGSPTFLLKCTSVEATREATKKLKLFHHCTSLGGVESMLERGELRFISGSRADHQTIRVSVGTEGLQDLISDLKTALE